MHAELDVEPAQPCLHRVDRDAELVGDAGVDGARGQEREQLQLTARERAVGRLRLLPRLSSGAIARGPGAGGRPHEVEQHVVHVVGGRASCSLEQRFGRIDEHRAQAVLPRHIGSAQKVDLRLSLRAREVGPGGEHRALDVLPGGARLDLPHEGRRYWLPAQERQPCQEQLPLRAGGQLADEPLGAHLVAGHQPEPRLHRRDRREQPSRRAALQDRCPRGGRVLERGAQPPVEGLGAREGEQGHHEVGHLRLARGRARHGGLEARAGLVQPPVLREAQQSDDARAEPRVQPVGVLGPDPPVVPGSPAARLRDVSQPPGRRRLDLGAAPLPQRIGDVRALAHGREQTVGFPWLAEQEQRTGLEQRRELVGVARPSAREPPASASGGRAHAHDVAGLLPEPGVQEVGLRLDVEHVGIGHGFPHGQLEAGAHPVQRDRRVDQAVRQGTGPTAAHEVLGRALLLGSRLVPLESEPRPAGDEELVLGGEEPCRRRLGVARHEQVQELVAQVATGPEPLGGTQVPHLGRGSAAGSVADQARQQRVALEPHELGLRGRVAHPQQAAGPGQAWERIGRRREGHRLDEVGRQLFEDRGVEEHLAHVRSLLVEPGPDERLSAVRAQPRDDVVVRAVPPLRCRGDQCRRPSVAEHHEPRRELGGEAGRVLVEQAEGLVAYEREVGRVQFDDAALEPERREGRPRIVGGGHSDTPVRWAAAYELGEGFEQIALGRPVEADHREPRPVAAC